MAPSITKNALDAVGLADGQLSPSISLEGTSFHANANSHRSPCKHCFNPITILLCRQIQEHRSMLCWVRRGGAEKPTRAAHRQAQWHKVHEHIQVQSLVDHWVGNSGKDVEHETQMMMLHKNESGRPYVLLLPLLEGSFRASLQPGVDDNLDICLESGSTQVCGPSFRSCLYMHVGDDAYDLVRKAMKVARVHLETFRLLDEKTPPGIVDKFGWCTWDAFYLNEPPKGVWEGVSGLVEGGCPPGMVLIDDGWQSICHDDGPISDQEGMNRTSAGEQMPCRLIKFEENYKFGDYKSTKLPTKKGMSAFIKDLKQEFKSVEYVYVWHALCGYWGGIRPNVPGMPPAKVITLKLSEGLQMTTEDLAVDKIVNNGIALVPPAVVHKMYEGLYSHLESVGIDGVKIDVIHWK